MESFTRQTPDESEANGAGGRIEKLPMLTCAYFLPLSTLR